MKISINPDDLKEESSDSGTNLDDPMIDTSNFDDFVESEDNKENESEDIENNDLHDDINEIKSRQREDRTEEEKYELETKEDNSNYSNSNSKIKKKKNKRVKKLESAHAETNEDYYSKYKDRVSNNKLRKNIISGIALFIIAFLVISNIYFIFFREVKSDLEIAKNVSLINGLYGYPEEGIESYLEDNFATILYNSGVTKADGVTGNDLYTISDINVLFVIPKNSKEANVYFDATVVTDSGQSTHNYLINLEYDAEIASYKPTTSLISSLPKNMNSADIDTDYQSIWSFGNIEKYNTDQTASLQTFLDNFYIILYNEKKAVTNYYDGTDNLGDDNCSYNNIDSVEYYTSPNQMNVNVKVTYKLTSAEGLTYTLTSYMLVEQLSSGSYMIHYIY